MTGHAREKSNQKQSCNSPGAGGDPGNIKRTGRCTNQKPEDQPAIVDIEDGTKHLPVDQAEILKRQVETPELRKGAGILYRYASRRDRCIMGVSSICAIGTGVGLPLMTVLFGNIQHTFQQHFLGQTSRAGFVEELDKFVLYFVYVGVGVFVATYICTVGFIYTGENITAKIRENYLKACLRQNIGFFEKIGAGEITTRITADTNLIQDGISEKVSLTIAAISTFISAFVIGFINCWKLTLILTSSLVALVLIMGTFSTLMLKYNKASIDAYAEGGAIAGDIISTVRNAVAFGTQSHLAMKYDRYLGRAEYFGIRVRAIMGLMLGGMMLIVYLSYALAFWQGSRYITKDIIPIGKVLTTMMAVMTGAFNIGNIVPNIQAFGTAISAAAKIFDTIDRQSPLDALVETGTIINNLQGKIRLEHVTHIYPSRPDVVVMEDVSIDLSPGKTTALVGTSGSGKSTIIELIERFYLPVNGTIFLDGVDITKLNLRWLRQQMALVSQEPVLFNTTVYENIRYGLIGSDHENSSEQKQSERVHAAAKMANAHGFVSALPDGYQTNVGEGGLLLSGGQKQRIAIARAVVSNPRILLLDEATSALDTKSEGVVQAALDAASVGRTTITIAHRLSTIKDAHNIVVIDAGRVVEQGTHDTLISKGGAYYKLVSAQNIPSAHETTSAEEDVPPQSQNSDTKCVTGPYDGAALELSKTETRKSAYEVAPHGDAQQKDGLWTLIKLIALFNAPEWKLMLFALSWSIIAGCGSAVSSVLFAKQISVLSYGLTAEEATTLLPAERTRLLNERGRQAKHDSDFWSVMFIILAIVEFIAFALQGVAFAICAAKLIRRVRDRTFRTILRQDIAFFDRKENTSGALTSFLSTETTHVSGLSGVTLGSIMLTLSTLISAIAVSVSIGWKLALVCIATLPVLLSCGFFRLWMLSHFQRRSKAAYTASASYAAEAVSCIRMVAALTREDDVLEQYRHSLSAQQRTSLVSVLKSSLLYSASQSALFLCFALGFWYGGQLIGDRVYSQFKFFVCFMCVIFGAQAAGTFFSFAPDMSKARQAAQEMKTLFDRQPTIDSWSDGGISVSDVDGTIEFRDVEFCYPTRPGRRVLQGLNLTVNPGQYVALVGASGCGKSTIISLLERFYSPSSGSIFVDGKDVSTLNINDYRSFIALVSQEPTLYHGTIRENIVLGALKEQVSDEALEAVCREANIYEFISSLPDGFDTMVGAKGTLLSGGQKQRVAIARALIRVPKILLLDEATSVLDSESEQVVQAAIDKAARGRTTIAVAHRLSTIQKADLIYVVDQGRVVESGTHSELMRANGRYAELAKLQNITM